MDRFHKNFDEEKGRAKGLDIVIKVLDGMPSGKKKLHNINVVSIITKDPESRLPEKMKKYYCEKGVKFGEFPMMPIGKGKNLAEQLPNAPEVTPEPYREAVNRVSVVRVGDDYYHGDQKVAKLGHLKELYPDAEIFV